MIWHMVIRSYSGVYHRIEFLVEPDREDIEQLEKSESGIVVNIFKSKRER